MSGPLKGLTVGLGPFKKVFKRFKEVNGGYSFRVVFSPPPRFFNFCSLRPGSTVHCLYGFSPPQNPGQNLGQKSGQKSAQKTRVHPGR